MFLWAPSLLSVYLIKLAREPLSISCVDFNWSGWQCQQLKRHGICFLLLQRLNFILGKIFLKEKYVNVYFLLVSINLNLKIQHDSEQVFIWDQRITIWGEHMEAKTQKVPQL